MERQFSKCIPGVVFMVLLLIGFFGFTASGVFNETAKESKKIHTDSTPTQEIDEILAQRIVNRKLWLKIAGKAAQITGTSQLNGVYMNEERLLAVTEPLSESALSDTADMITDYYRQLEIPTCVVALPSNTDFYGDTYNVGVANTMRQEELENFYDAIPTPIRKIDVKPILQNMTDSYIYYRTDSRITEYGAYCIYQSMIQKLGFVSVSYDHFTVNHARRFQGDLYERCLYEQVTSDSLDVYTCDTDVTVNSVVAWNSDTGSEERELYQNSSEQDPMEYYYGTCAEKITITTSLKSDKKLLLVGDTNCVSVIPFLEQHYSEICWINVEQAQTNLTELMGEETFHQILFFSSADSYADTETFATLLEGKA